MGFQQDTIIYIENQDKLDASAAANSFADRNVKNRAYVNTLGAELTLKYLASENINISGIYNIHSIKKILEELDISDIMLPNIHIDVRVVFDENLIFIPKSHFKYNLVPDIYVVLNLAEDFSHVKLLGFFEPKLINKNNQNHDYYFIEKEKLNPPSDLKTFIENFKGNTTSGISEHDIENSERIIMAMADNDVSEDEKQYLIKQMKKSAQLRDKFIEYENFETLSYKAMTDPQILKKEIDEDNTPMSEDKQSDQPLYEENNFETPAGNISDGTAPENSIESIESIETFDSLENFDNLELEPVENIENISPDDALTQTQNSGNETVSEGIAELGAGAAGIIAGTAAVEGAAGAVEATELSADSIENALNIVDTGIEVEKDLVNTETEAPEPIAFDEIDTSALDNIAYPNADNYEEETISFDNIDTSGTHNDIDYINEIDNKISFDDIELPEETTTENQGNKETQPQTSDTISLDDIDTSFMDETPNLPSVEDETISLDDIDTSALEGIEELDNADSGVIELTETPGKEEQAPNTTNTENNINEPESMDDSDLQIEDLQIDFPEEIDNSEDLNVEPLKLMDDGNESVSNTAENDSDVDFEALNSELPETPLGNDSSGENIQADSSSGSFGKNLLENITEENISNISIDDLGLDETPISKNVEEITSDELLSQIDSILNSTEEEVPSPQINDSEQTNLQEQGDSTDNPLQDIPDIDSLVSSPLTEPDTHTPVMPENSVDDTAYQTTASQDDEDISDFNIDELLNMGDNSDTQNEDSENDKLNVLFNDTDPTSDTELDSIDQDNTFNPVNEEQQAIPGAAFLKQKKSNKKTLITTAALVAILAGASAFVFLKPKSDTTSDIEPAVPSPTETVKNKPVNSNDENILETNAPTINKSADKKVQQTKKQVKELKNTPAVKKPISTESYLEVNRLVWDVPDVLSYSPKIQNYLRTAGKSIKLSLSADLLLATEYAYSNQVKVSLKLSKDGNVQDAKIISSSGSTEIDNIVLQSVKDTLNVVKPPSNEISTPDFNLNLIIYF